MTSSVSLLWAVISFYFISVNSVPVPEASLLSCTSRATSVIVTCSQTGLITGITYNTKIKLNGTIPSSLATLTALTSLNLGYNSITGTIPTEMGRLSNLQNLILSNNLLNGTIPSELFKLPALISLDLTRNSLSGALPSADAQNTPVISFFAASFNNLTGTIPTNIGRLTSLTSISLRSNLLIGSIPTEISLLQSMKSLNLAYNSLVGAIPTEIAALTSLLDIQLGYNSLSSLPSELGALVSLTALYVDFTGLQGTVPKELGSIKSLARLSANGNNLTGSIPTELGRLTALTFLNFNVNGLTGTIPTELAMLTRLSSVGLNINQICGAVPPNFCPKPSCSLAYTAVTCAPSPLPSYKSTAVPSKSPSRIPSSAPSDEPSAGPSGAPSGTPSVIPTALPSAIPSLNPTAVETNAPSHFPTTVSYDLPTLIPTPISSDMPSIIPTAVETNAPSYFPTSVSSDLPTLIPTPISSDMPSITPTAVETDVPTYFPIAVSDLPTLIPTPISSDMPSITPTAVETDVPSYFPVAMSSDLPTLIPTPISSDMPSITPTAVETDVPSYFPIAVSSDFPTLIPTPISSDMPSITPTAVETDVPSYFPIAGSSDLPTLIPTQISSDMPSITPTAVETDVPSYFPIAVSSDLPALIPTTPISSDMPSITPTAVETDVPTYFPIAVSDLPTLIPTPISSEMPSITPTSVESNAPSQFPTLLSSDLPTLRPTSVTINFVDVERNLSNSESAQEVRDIYMSLGNFNSSLVNSCSDDSGCTFGRCIDGSCVTSTKTCLSSLQDSACSNHGVCNFWSVEGVRLETCEVTSSLCFARCSCDSNYYGGGCELNNEEYSERSYIRSSICRKLGELAMSTESFSESSMAVSIETLRDIYSAGPSLSDANLEVCTRSLDFFLFAISKSNQSKISEPFFEVISTAIQNSIYKSISSEVDNVQTILNITNIVNNATSIVLRDIDEGQNVSIITTSFDLKAFKLPWASLHDMKFTTDISSNNSITLSDGLNACKLNADDPSPSFSVMQWFLDPYYADEEKIVNNIFRWSYGNQNYKSPESLTSQTSEEKDTFLLNLAYKSEQVISLTPDLFGNQTIPKCLVRDTTSTKYSDCDCSLASYTNYSALFSCAVVSSLCPLNRDLGNKVELRPDKVRVTFMDYGVILTSAGEVFANVLTKNPFGENVVRNFTVISILIAWLGVLFIGLYYFSKWDQLDKKILLYTPVVVKNKKVKKFSELNDFRQSIDLAFLQGQLIETTDDANTMEAEFVSRWGLIRRIKLLFAAITCRMVSKRENHRVSLLVGGDYIPRLLYAIRSFHPFVWFFSFRSIEKTRVIRFVSTWKTILVIMLISAVFFDIYYADDGSCSSRNTDEMTCLSQASRVFADEPLCSWDEDSRSCGLKPPPISAAFVISVSILTTMVMLPFDILFFMLLHGVCSKRPEVERIGLKAFAFLGSAGPEAKGLSPQLEEDAITAVLAAFRSYCIQYSSKESTSEDNVRAAIVLDKFGLQFDPTIAEVKLTFVSSLMFSNVRSCVGYYIHNSYVSAQCIIESLRRCKDEASRASYILQRFILERFGLFTRFILRRQFGHITVDAPLTINPIVWVMAWIFVIVTLAFIMLWVFLWAASRGQLCANSWVINSMISTILEVFIVSIVRVFIIDILIVDLLMPKVVVLRNRFIELQSIVPSSENEPRIEVVAHYISPSYLAAQDQICDDYYGSRIIRCFDSIRSHQQEAVFANTGVIPVSIQKERKGPVVSV